MNSDAFSGRLIIPLNMMSCSVGPWSGALEPFESIFPLFLLKKRMQPAYCAEAEISRRRIQNRVNKFHRVDSIGVDVAGPGRWIEGNNHNGHEEPASYQQTVVSGHPTRPQFHHITLTFD